MAEFDRELHRSRLALEQVPEGKYDWKPHDRPMIFGYLADLVAIMPSWIARQVTNDELDVAPADGSSMKQEPKKTSAAGHHRGQMTVYLRLLGAKVPAIYGASADDKSF